MLVSCVKGVAIFSQASTRSYHGNLSTLISSSADTRRSISSCVFSSPKLTLTKPGFKPQKVMHLVTKRAGQKVQVTLVPGR